MRFWRPRTFGRRRSGLACSFCGKPCERVRKLIAGPDVYICNECVQLCVEIIEEEEKERL